MSERFELTWLMIILSNTVLEKEVMGGLSCQSLSHSTWLQQEPLLGFRMGEQLALDSGSRGRKRKMRRDLEEAASFQTSPASWNPAWPSKTHCWVRPLQRLGCRCFPQGINATSPIIRVEKVKVHPSSAKDESNSL